MDSRKQTLHKYLYYILHSTYIIYIYNIFVYNISIIYIIY